jgi:hypothetical protein
MLLKEYMALALTKYKTLKMKCEWGAPSPEQEQIIALNAAVTSLRAKAKESKGKPPGWSQRDGENQGASCKNDRGMLGKTSHPKQVSRCPPCREARNTSGAPGMRSRNGPYTIRTRFPTCASFTLSMPNLRQPGPRRADPGPLSVD